MTLGGVWALMPDIPRIFREDFPGTPLAGLLGSKTIDRLLNEWGNLFFFHRSLDAQPHEYALHGLVIILVLYNASIASLMWMEASQRNDPVNRGRRHHARYRKRRRDPDADSPLDAASSGVVARINADRLSDTG